MSLVLRVAGSGLAAVQRRLPAVPPGTLLYGARVSVALWLALYAAFWLQLESASSAAVCVAILAQPNRGQAFSKAAYRALGTMVGAVVSVLLVALFPQDRLMLLGSFMVWMALCTAAGTLLRDFRAYGTVLAGYTVAIVAITDIDAPGSVFDAAVARVAVILLGVAALFLVNDAASPGAWNDMLAALQKQMAALRDYAVTALRGGPPPDGARCLAMSGAIMPLRSQTSFVGIDEIDGANRAAGGRSAILAMLEQLDTLRAVTELRGEAGPTGAEACSIAESGLGEGDPEGARRRLADVAARGDAAAPATRMLLYRLDRLLAGEISLRDGLHAVRTGEAPARFVRLAPHLDPAGAGFNALRVLIAMAFTCWFCVLSGWSATSFVIVNVVANCALGFTNPNPAMVGLSAMIGIPVAVLVAAPLQLLVLPLANGFPLLAITLALPVLAGCTFQVLYPRYVGVGTLFMVQVMVLVSPSNPQGFDPVTFLDRATMLLLSALFVFFAFQIILPISPRRRRFRLALAVFDDAVARLRGRRARNPGQAARHHLSRLADRLNQWQSLPGSGVPSPARARLVERLVLLGEFDVALLRADAALRALPEAVAAPGRAALARPEAPRLREAAAALLAHASGVPAAAELYRAAYVLEREMPLLRRLHLAAAR